VAHVDALDLAIAVRLAVTVIDSVRLAIDICVDEPRALAGAVRGG
jgi:hypothetical protein